MSLTRKQIEERRLKQEEIMPRLGGNHVTWLGRFELEYRTAAWDIAHSIRERELRILMLGCATGRTTFDALAIFTREMSKIQAGTRVRILGVDMAGPAIEYAQNAYFPVSKDESNAIPRIYGEMPWANIHDGALVIDFEEIRAQGHEVEFRKFDIDSGLANLGEPPFHLVEAINSHHETHHRDMENIGSILAPNGLIQSGYYWGQPRDSQLKELLTMLHSIDDPASLRFISGLIPAKKATDEEISAYRTPDAKARRITDAPLSVKREIEVYKALNSLGQAALKVNKKSAKEKRGFLEKNPLLRTLAKMTRHDFFDMYHIDGLSMFERVADPEVKRALHAMHRFAHKELGIHGWFRKLTKFSKR